MDRDGWAKALRGAERELEAAKTLTAVKAAAKKLQRAKAELRELEGKSPPAPRRADRRRERARKP